MCLEAGDGGVKYDVKRVNLGKNYLGIACEKPGRFRRPILPRLLTLGCNRTKMAEDPLRSKAARLTKRFQPQAGIRIHINFGKSLLSSQGGVN